MDLGKKRGLKRGQIISFDLIIAVITFIVFLGVFIGLYFVFQKQTLSYGYDFEIEYAFANLENNLRTEYLATGRNIDFLNEYRIDKQKLQNFFDDFSGQSINAYAIGTILDSHGIGLSDQTYDVCLYLTDNDGSKIRFSGLESIGRVKSGTCNDAISSSKNPCDGYSQAVSFFKPVLFDELTPSKNRILQINLVLCKK